MNTYHILNGDCLAEQLRATGIQGEFIVCRECLIEGPVNAATPDTFFDLRKDFLHKFHGVDPEQYHNNSVKEIEKINSLGTESNDSEKWEEIGTNTFSTFEQAERVSDDIDEDAIALVFAAILLREYSDLLGSENATAMRRYLGDAKNQDDVLLKIQATQKLKVLTDEYPVLITLFTIKMASDKAVKVNPTDGHKLLQMHDQIVNHFRNGRKKEAFTLLDEAIALRDTYDQGGRDIGSIHLKK